MKLNRYTYKKYLKKQVLHTNLGLRDTKNITESIEKVSNIDDFFALSGKIAVCDRGDRPPQPALPESFLKKLPDTCI